MPGSGPIARHLDTLHPHGMDDMLSVVAQYGRNPFGPIVDNCCPAEGSQELSQSVISDGSDQLSRVKRAETQAWHVYVPGEKGAKYLKKLEPRRDQKRHDRNLQCSARPIIVVPPPTSQSIIIASRLAHAIKAIDSEFSWIAVGPSLIGKDKVFDIAALACSQACEYYLQRNSGIDDEALRRAALDNYDLAVSRLRRKLSSSTRQKSSLDFAAATSGALSTAGSMIRVHDDRNRTIDGEEGFIHYDSLSRYLVVDAAMGRAPSAIHRTIFHDIIRYKYFRACSLGTLDGAPEFPRKYQSYWDLMTPYSFGTRTEYWDRLQSASQKIDARLPDLIQYIQQLRQGDAVPSSEVIELSQHLLTLQDRAAEDVAKSIGRLVDSEANRWILPKSMDFTGCPHWPVLVHYWALLLTCTHLCLEEHRMLDCLPDQQVRALSYSRDRIAKNILMTVPHAMQGGAFSRLQPFHALVVVWAADPQIQGLQIDNLRDWILETLRDDIGVGFAQGWTAADLKQRAALFAMTTPD